MKEQEENLFNDLTEAFSETLVKYVYINKNYYGDVEIFKDIEISYHLKKLAELGNEIINQKLKEV